MRQHDLQRARRRHLERLEQDRHIRLDRALLAAEAEGLEAGLLRDAWGARDRSRETAEPTAARALATRLGAEAAVLDDDLERAAETSRLVERLTGALGVPSNGVTVRVDAAAQRQVERLGARGVADRDVIYLHPGRYDPSTRAGRELLAHELVHVAQRPGVALATGRPDQPAAEREAAALASRFGAGHAIGPPRQLLPAYALAADNGSEVCRSPEPADVSAADAAADLLTRMADGDTRAAMELGFAYGQLTAAHKKEAMNHAFDGPFATDELLSQFLEGLAFSSCIDSEVFDAFQTALQFPEVRPLVVRTLAERRSQFMRAEGLRDVVASLGRLGHIDEISLDALLESYRSHGVDRLLSEEVELIDFLDGRGHTRAHQVVSEIYGEHLEIVRHHQEYLAQLAPLAQEQIMLLVDAHMRGWGDYPEDANPLRDAIQLLGAVGDLAERLSVAFPDRPSAAIELARSIGPVHDKLRRVLRLSNDVLQATIAEEVADAARLKAFGELLIKASELLADVGELACVAQFKSEAGCAVAKEVLLGLTREVGLSATGHEWRWDRLSLGVMGAIAVEALKKVLPEGGATDVIVNFIEANWGHITDGIVNGSSPAQIVASMKDELAENAIKAATKEIGTAIGGEFAGPHTKVWEKIMAMVLEAVGGELAGLVQQKLGDGAPAEGTRRAAALGLSGSGSALPHLGRIQHAFGRHDVSGIRAHLGPAAASATRAMGAEAYASGSSVAFRGSPDLHTAAHEAAHVVQQRAGVSLAGGVGRAGDRYEQHADAVADRVVRGESAEDLLDGFVGGGVGAGVQLKDQESKKKQTSPEPPVLDQAALDAARRYNEDQPFVVEPKKVMALQRALGVPETGVMDDATTVAVVAFQHAKGLVADGMAGEDTQKALVKAFEAEKLDLSGGRLARNRRDEYADWEVTPPSAAEGEPTERLLSNAQIQAARSALQAMQPRLNPAWVMRCQEALGVEATGGYHRAFFEALATFQRDRVGDEPTALLSDANLRGQLTEAFPQLAGVSEFAEAEEAAASTRGSDSKAPAWLEQAIDEVFGQTWDQFRGDFRETELCGRTVRGHALLIERVQVAQRYLEERFHLTGVALGEAVGCHSIADFRKTTAPGYHPTGFAFDIGVADNPWIFGQDDRDEANRRTRDVIERATRFMGYGSSLTLSSLGALSETMTTDELYDHLQATNVALRNYRLLRGDDEAIRARWQEAGAEVQAHDVAWWKKQIATDDKALAYQGSTDAKRKTSNWDSSSAVNKGFMTMRKELVVALRDVAGLSWGACDMGSDSGDTMHFDARTIDKAREMVKKAKSLGPKSQDG